MATAAERLSDALVKHQIDIERLKKGTAAKYVKLLRRADAAMVAELRSRLDRFGQTGPTAARKIKSLNKLISAVIDGRKSVWLEMQREFNKEMRAIGKAEAVISNDLLTQAVGLEEFDPPQADPVVVGAAVAGAVWQGRTTAQHLKALEIAEREVIRQAIRQGVFDGLAPEAIVGGLRGSRGFGMTDGALQRTRNGLATLAGTAINSAIMNGRQVAFEDSGVVTGLVWTSILDGRTTLICQSRDGHGVPFDSNFPKDIPLLQPQAARPPAHYNCRSYMEATLRDVGVVKPHRVFVTDTRTNKKRVIDFRAQAKAEAGAQWSRLTERQRRRRIRAVANAWANANIGTVAPQVSYPQWLKRQSASFQDSVLGPTRGSLFRNGGLEIRNFTDQSGRVLTLEQLQSQYPGAFARAGFGDPPRDL